MRPVFLRKPFRFILRRCWHFAGLTTYNGLLPGYFAHIFDRHTYAEGNIFFIVYVTYHV